MKNEPENMPRDAVDDSLDELLRNAQWPDDATDPLNGLLRLAQWPEPTGECRLSLRESSLTFAERKATLAYLAIVATAAAVLLAALAIESARVIAKKPAITVVPFAEGNNPKITTPSLPLREERLSKILQQVRERPVAEDEAIDRMIARRIADPDGDLEELVQPLMARRAEFEQRMLARFNTYLGERETAAVELLGCLGSKASLPLVHHERFKASTHIAAVRALLRLAGDRTLARLERQEWDAGLREEIVAELQSRNDRQIETSTLFKGDQSCIENGPDLWPQADLF
jgi:hypothetical protein